MTGLTVRSKLRRMQAAQNTTSEEITADDGFRVATAPVEKRLNPLADFIDDDTFTALSQYALFDRKSLRDYQIRKSYQEMRVRMPSGQALEQLHTMYPYLELDTIRKIVYQMTPKVS